MNQTFEEWLKDRRQDDENRRTREAAIDEISQDVRQLVYEIALRRKVSGAEYCICDDCIMATLREWHPSAIIQLAKIGLESVLGDNHNGSSAAYYYSYRMENAEK